MEKAPAIDNLSSSFYPGEFVVITGPSGCGKSTLCRCLNGLIPQASDGRFTGDVLVKGTNTRDCDVSDLSTLIGMVFQDPENQLLANTVENEVTFGPENLGLSPGDIEERVSWALAITGIEGLRNRLIDELSGGEKQRVAVAASMAMKPEILVLDEPTSEIDPKGAQSLIDTLKGLNETTNLTIVLIEHRLERLLGAMSRLIIMDTGKIAYDGRPEEVFGQDLGRIGIFEPPLVRFSHKFGLPYFRSVVDISRDSAWRVEMKKASAAHGEPIASVRNVHYRYPGTSVDVLKGVTLDIYRGEIVAIMGANGSGKTTLVKHLNGLFRPYKGQVLLKGNDIEGRTVAENARSVGYVFQNVNHQFFEETVLGELLFAPANLGVAGDTAMARAHEVAASLGLGERELAVSPFLLSGGEKQRVAIASSLTMAPDIIVLDEPTLGLNQGLKERLAAILNNIKNEGRAVVLVTHDIEFAVLYADRVVLMAGGKAILDGSTRDVLTSGKIEDASLHISQAAEIGKRLGLEGVLTIDELVRGVS
jgi:energy-coupling factor transport system ATP-binding protein